MNKNFDHLTHFRNSDQLSIQFANKWVKPFYMTDLTTDNYSKRLELVSHELTKKIVKNLLGDLDWRSKITGANFSAIMGYKDFEEQIGVLFLKSEAAYAAEGYALALATFNTEKSVDYLTRYLEYYLQQNDLWYDQNDAMAALKWLDQQNGTDYHVNFLEPWNGFIANKPNWSLDRTYSKLEKKMWAIKKLSETIKSKG